MVSKKSWCQIGVGLLLFGGAAAALSIGIVAGPTGLIVGGVIGIAVVGIYCLSLSMRRAI